MNIKSIIKFTTITLLFATVITSCKKNYEAPPASTDPNLPVTTTIKALKAMHTVAGAFDVINTDITISGVVIANDKSGNLYKEIYIQDATGAIAVELASSGLYANYPVGKKVYIKCNGLCISDYNNLIQLGVKALINGTYTLEGIPTPLISNYVVGGSLNNPVVPKVVASIDGLNTPTGVATMQNPLLGDLIQLNDMEFLAGDTKRPYADTSYYKKSGDRYIKSCSSPTTIDVRTSGYADFAGKVPQSGNGSIVAIYTVYNTTKQLLIRDTTDVKFNNPRCYLFEEDFQAYTTTTGAWSSPGWQNIQESGDVPYTMASFSGNIFPKISAFGSAALATTAIKSWLITPGIDIPTGLTPKYTFTCSRRYTAGTFKALVSTNYNGGNNPSASTWTTLITVPAGTATAFTPFDTFGPFDFTPYIGKKVYLAFLYEAPAGTSPSLVGTYEPDDLKISKN
jgi:hypothetical protein